MKTAIDVLERAMNLCGMTNPAGVTDHERDSDIYKKGLALVEQIYLELWYIERPGEEPPMSGRIVMDSARPIPLSFRAVNDIMPYGVAMLLAQSMGDANAQSAFAVIYNQKRQSARKRCERVADVLPSVEGYPCRRAGRIKKGW